MTGAAAGGDGGPVDTARPALEITGLTCRFGGLAAVNDVSLRVRQGARFGIIGPNGAGKTTLFNLLSGEIRPTAGTVRLFGRDVTRLPPPSRVRLGLGRTFQITRVFADLTVRENLTLAIHGLERSKLNPLRSWRRYAQQQARIGDLAASFGLGQRLDQVARELSHGELRELEVLLALAVQPQVLLLDEPAAGLSPAERLDIQALLTGLPSTLTLVMIDHDMQVLREVVDWIAVLHYGNLVTEGPTEQIQNHPAVRELYLGSSGNGNGDASTGGARKPSAQADADSEPAGGQP